MILTHFLALIATATPALIPVGSVLPLASTEPLLGDGNLDLALVPAVPVRSAITLLLIRER